VANGLEPKLSPFESLAVFDEIARLVPGYVVDRMNLLGGNDVQTEPGFVPVAALTGEVDHARPRRIICLRNAGAAQHGAHGIGAISGAIIAV